MVVHRENTSAMDRARRIEREFVSQLNRQRKMKNVNIFWSRGRGHLSFAVLRLLALAA